MFTAEQYRVKAAEFNALLANTPRSPNETSEFRNLAQTYTTLAENEDWMASNLDKMNSPGADKNPYGDAIRAQHGKHTI